MTANYSADSARFLSEQLERDEPNLLRSLLQTFIDALMGGYAIGRVAPLRCGRAIRSTLAMVPGRGSGTPGAGTIEVAIAKQQATYEYKDRRAATACPTASSSEEKRAATSR